MSLGTRHARTKIACAVGALIVIKDNDLATKEIRDKIYAGIIRGGITLQNYPDTGDPRRNDTWCRKVIRSLDPDIEALGIYTYKTLIWYAHLLMNDLTELSTNKNTLRLVGAFDQIIKDISAEVIEDHIDVFYDKANILVNRLYQQLGYFEREW